MFETIVVDILNRLFENYFENLDPSQLRLGIWNGEIVLRDLLLRNSALDDINVPFKILVGKVGSLVMKIPWQNLYTSPLELRIQDLLLLVGPSYSIKYDPVAEEKAAEYAKVKEIERLDEIRVKEQVKKVGETGETFTEKLKRQIMENIQITIETIHVRYEDDVTKSPVGFGVTLKSFKVQTTNSDWIPCVITEDVETFNKLATLESLSVYWNFRTELIHSHNRSASEMLELLREYVTSGSHRVTYILGPTNFTAKLTLTPSPDGENYPFTKPKSWIDALMKELVLGMANLRFEGMNELVESIDYLFRAQIYRKYRPSTNEHHCHYKEWWKYAYQCIVEEDIRRRLNNWDWNHMKRHRNLCKTYAKAYYEKLSTPNPKADVLNTLRHCERNLDILNIALVRKPVELRVEKREENMSTWFFGWGFRFSSSSQQNSDLTFGDIMTVVNRALTPAEKTRLFPTIDYTTDTKVMYKLIYNPLIRDYTKYAMELDYPKDYIKFSLSSQLAKLSTTISEVRGHKVNFTRNVLELEIDNR